MTGENKNSMCEGTTQEKERKKRRGEDGREENTKQAANRDKVGSWRDVR